MKTRSRLVVVSCLLLAAGTLSCVLWRDRTYAVSHRTVTVAGQVPLPPRPAPRPAPIAAVASSARKERDSAPPLAKASSDWRNFAPTAFNVQLAPGLNIPFRVTKVARENGRTVLRARVAKADMSQAAGLDGAFYVSTSNAADRLDAIVVLPGEEYHITVRGSVQTVQQVPLQFRCGVEADQAGPGSQPFMLPQATAAATTAANVSDVLFLYGPDALADRSNDVASMDADCSNYVEAGNAILENSLVTNLAWRYLGLLAAPAYTTTSKIGDDLAAMTNGTLATFVANSQFSYGADQVVLLVGGIWRRTDAAGMAVLGPGGKHYAAVAYPWTSSSFQPDGTLKTTIVATPSSVPVHEMGHAFGCQHDRQTMNAPDGNGQYSYGYRFADNSVSPAIPDEGTIMSYAGNIIPYFSNPNVTYHGYALGVPVDQPKAAYNAKVLTDNAATVAATNPAISVPAITQQPQSTTAQTGKSFSLSVTASGGDLSYQWFKDGAAISGATASIYAVASAASVDGGSYTVTAANALGTATSSAASVTVSTAPPPSSGGGSGGGGGAFGPLFVVGLFALAGGRMIRWRRSVARP